MKNVINCVHAIHKLLLSPRTDAFPEGDVEPAEANPEGNAESAEANAEGDAEPAEANTGDDGEGENNSSDSSVAEFEIVDIARFNVPRPPNMQPTNVPGTRSILDPLGPVTISTNAPDTPGPFDRSIWVAEIEEYAPGNDNRDPVARPQAIQSAQAQPLILNGPNL